MNRQYISVFALNKYIKAKLNQDVSLQNIYIKGEISNWRPHPSGHLYFTLKDEHSRISAVMFASQARKLQFDIENGMQVLIKANVSVYEVTGQYQLYIQMIEQDGIGNLYLQFENLKKKLENEGLFAQHYKKSIPAFPKSIAILSAKQGAAVQDVVRTIHLRFPFTQMIVFPIPVQGKGAYTEIIKTLKSVDEIGFDIIILARGGGSIEDLWNFNEEELVRCIFALKTPIITGIGHETDFTLCDFVSDFRAVTPTAAAIQATPDQNELKKYNVLLKKQLNDKMNRYIEYHSQHFLRLKESYYLKNPDYLYSQHSLYLIQLKDQLSHQMKMFHIKQYQQLQHYQYILKQNIDQKMIYAQKDTETILAKLDALSPLKVMCRGYTLIKKEDQIIKHGKDLKTGDFIQIVFHDRIKKAEIK